MEEVPSANPVAADYLPPGTPSPTYYQGVYGLQTNPVPSQSSQSSPTVTQTPTPVSTTQRSVNAAPTTSATNQKAATVSNQSITASPQDSGTVSTVDTSKKDTPHVPSLSLQTATASARVGAINAKPVKHTQIYGMIGLGLTMFIGTLFALFKYLRVRNLTAAK